LRIADCGLTVRSFRIAVIAGDGIGPEVIKAALPSIQAAGKACGADLSFEHLPYGADHYLKTGETLPEVAFQHLRDETDAILLGAVGDPRVPGNEHARDILLGLRFKLDLYINFRPSTLLHPDLCPLRSDGRMSGGADNGRGIDFVIFRENTEGPYLARGSARFPGTMDEEQISEDVNTAAKVERIIRAAFEWAQSNGKTLVTMADKSNAIPAHRLWQRLFNTVGEQFPEIQREHRYVDALAMELVQRPGRFQVIVTTNLFGDILSDLGAGLVGGLGVAASANLHPGRPGLFEPVHGSAPAQAGKNTANPVAAVLTGALMLSHLGLADGARLLESAVRDSLHAGVRTADVGGTRTTADVGAWIAAKVGTASG
jgi:3-isopropylmalate dehydrogenase